MPVGPTRLRQAGVEKAVIFSPDGIFDPQFYGVRRRLFVVAPRDSPRVLWRRRVFSSLTITPIRVEIAVNEAVDRGY